MKIEKFEDLDCWKRAKEWANLVYDLTNQLHACIEIRSPVVNDQIVV